MQNLSRPDVTLEVIKTLKGHSGCIVELIKVREKVMVRKTSSSTSYNKRLLRQIDKQIRLHFLIPVPKIFSSVSEGELTFFDMEFIRGRDLKSQCFKEPASWIFPFTDKLMSHLRILSNNRRDEDLSLALRNKCKEIENNVRSHYLFEDYSYNLLKAINILSFFDWKNIPATECHGDLTFENIIFRDNADIVYIDLLDGDYESVWLDVAKLLFDLEIGWSLRNILWHENGPEARLLTMFNRHLRDEIIYNVKICFPDIFICINQMKIFQAMRIIPYTKDRFTLHRLNTYISNLLAVE